jgi:hypothetical protein
LDTKDLKGFERILQFSKYSGFGTKELFGCNKLSGFRNHSIPKSAAILEF